MSGIRLNRAWQVRAGVAILAGLGVIVAPVWYLRAALPDDAFFRTATYPDIIFAVLLACMLAITTVWQGLAARREREYARLRAAAIAGESTALPRASLTYDWYKPPAQQGVPLVVVWHADLFNRLLFGPFALLLFGLGFPLFVLLLMSVIVDLTIGDHQHMAQFYTHASPGSGSELPIMLGVAIFMIPFAFVAARYGWRLMFQRITIEANDEGLRWSGRWGRERLIRWQDARLYEVSQFHRFDLGSHTRKTINRYCLYSAGAAITWTNDDDWLNREMRARLGQLLRAVGKRSHCALRTTSGALAATPMLGYIRWRQMRLRLLGAGWLLYTLVTLACVLIVPPTTAAPLNALITLSLVALLAIGTMAVWLATRHQRLEHLTPADNFNELVEYARTESLKRPIQAVLYPALMFVTLLLLAADALPLISVLWYRGAFPFGLSSTALVPTGFQIAVAFMLGIYGFIGVIGAAVVIVLVALLPVLLLVLIKRIRSEKTPRVRRSPFS